MVLLSSGSSVYMDEAKIKGATEGEAIILEVAANAIPLVASERTAASSGSEAESSSSKKRSRPKKEAGDDSLKKRRRSRKEKSKDVSMETKRNITKATEPEPTVSAENSNTSCSSSVEQSLQEVDEVQWKKCDSTLEASKDKICTSDIPFDITFLPSTHVGSHRSYTFFSR